MRLAKLLLPILLGATMTTHADDPSSAMDKKPATGAAPRVLIETSLGNITAELDAAKAPKSTENFLAYAKAGHFDGLTFHRVIKGFMIQGGGYDVKGVQRSTRAPIENEAKNGLKNVRGSLAMARTGDPHSASSQFFINHADNSFLDYPGRDGWGYAVFGKVVEGMDVVDKIAEVQTDALPPTGRDVPVVPVLMKRVTVVQAGRK